MNGVRVGSSKDLVTVTDELRKSADEWNSSNMFELARMCSEAVDTIWELRDDLQRANAENAKLRELVSWMYDRMDESCAVQYPYAPTPISYDRLMQAQARACELGVEVDG